MPFWYQQDFFAKLCQGLLWPLALLYGRLMRLRFLYFRQFPPKPLPVPVIVVGNLSVGGSGKTPVVGALVEYFQSQGKKVGVVSRGYGRKNKNLQQVNAMHSSAEVGDEPRWLFWQTQAPIVVAKKRRAAAEALIKQGIEIIIADDGLQHYALGRKVEIALVGEDLGNQLSLPAGPLREGLWRLKHVDLTLGFSPLAEFSWQVAPAKVWPLAALWQNHPGQSLADFATVQNAKAQKTVFALAGIARPSRFFNSLRQADLAILPLAFPDHAPLHFHDVPEASHGYPTLMTGKDAVRLFNQPEVSARSDLFFIDYQLKLPEAFFKRLEFLLEQ